MEESYIDLVFVGESSMVTKEDSKVFLEYPYQVMVCVASFLHIFV